MKLPKQVNKFIKVVKNDLPIQYYQSKKTEHFRGEVLLKEGVKKVEDKEIDTNGSYTRTSGVKHEINHARRMRKAYQLNGAQGLINYLLPYCKPEDKENIIIDINNVCNV